ncbi:MBG domain-containing protein [Parapedobacter koreensis]|nr:MBG domain-containing protein [Parapedobacter koreensis]
MAILLPVLLILAAFSLRAQELDSPPTIRYVKVGGQGSGFSWGDASGDLQAMIDQSDPGDEVWVATGEYSRAATGQSFSMKEGVKIYGGFPAGATSSTGMEQRDWKANETILKGNSASVVRNDRNGLTPEAVLDGFILTGGLSASGGGGVYNVNVSPTFRNVIIQGNATTELGAGGGMFNYGASPVLEQVIIRSNHSDYSGGGICNSEDSSPILTHVFITGNTADGDGGGIANLNKSSPRLTNVIISENGRNSPITGNGGGMYNSEDCTPILTNVLIANNVVNGNGGGISNVNSGAPQLTNVTIASNRSNSQNGGGGMYNGSPSDPVLVVNSIVWGNTANGTSGQGIVGSIDASYNFIQGVAGISTDPLFTDAAGGNYTLQRSSPAINAGDPQTNVPADAVQAGETDLAGNPRIAGGRIDLGAYEWQLRQQTLTVDGLDDEGNLHATYGDADLMPTVHTTSGKPVTLNLPSESDVATITGDGKIHIDNAGTVALTFSVEGDDEYGPASLTVTLQVVPKALIVTAKNAAKTFNDMAYNGGNGVDYVGFIDGEGVAVLNGELTYGGEAQGAVDVGTYRILPSGLTARNYAITFVAGTLTVVQPEDVDIRYVKEGGTGSGLSWQTASGDLQAMIDASETGNQVWVASGGYRRAASGQSFSMKEGVKIYGGFPVGATKGTGMEERNWKANQTILRGYSANVVRNENNNLTAIAVLDGFTLTAGSSATGGGGVYNEGVSPTFQNIIIESNYTDADGGGMYNSASSPILIQVLITDNNATGNGAGIANIGGSNPRLTSVTISENTTSTGDGGGGMYNSASSPLLTNVLIADNSANGGGSGGGLNNVNGSNPELTNVTIARNWVNGLNGGRGGGVYNDDTSTPVLVNSIVWDNTANGSSGLGGVVGPMQYTYSVIQGVVSTDPLFTDADGLDYTLRWGSPAINAGDPRTNVSDDAVQVGDTDLAGNPRIIDGRIDLGAYEQQWKSQTPTVDGLDGDGKLRATYGDADFVPDVNTESNAPVTLGLPFENQVATITEDGKIHILNVGEVELRIDIEGNEEYGPASLTVNLLVVPKALTITAKDATKTFNGLAYNGGNGVDYDGFVDGDGVAVLNGELTYEGDAQGAVDAGTFSILPSGLTASNYAITFVAGTLTIEPPEHVEIRYVKENGTGSGLSWQFASGDLQAMIDASDAGNQVWVATGQYQPEAGESFSMKEGVRIYGGFPNLGNPGMEDRDWSLHKTILVGNGNSVVRNDNNNLTAAAVLDGFTIRSGRGAANGGGIYNRGTYNTHISRPTLSNLVIEGNHASTYGGGVYNEAASPVLTNVLISGNIAAFGGAMYNYDASSPVLVNVTISGNHGGIRNVSAGFNGTQECSPTLVNTIIWNNSYPVTGSTPPHSFSIDNSGNSRGRVGISYSLIANSGGSGGGWVAEIGDDGGNNLDADPLFEGPLEPPALLSSPTVPGGDYDLNAGSPVINKGDQQTNNVGYTVQAGDFDLAFKDRIVGGRIDMGVFERSFSKQDIVVDGLEADNLYRIYGDEDFVPEATSGLPVAISLPENTVARVVDGKVHILSAGSVGVTFSVEGNDVYDPASLTVTLQVSKKPLTATLGSDPAITKVYEGTVIATLAQANYILDGVVEGDEVMVSGKAEYEDPNVGEDKEITATDFVLSGTDAGNYTIAEDIQMSTKGSITPAIATLTLSGLTHIYDGTAKVATVITDPVGLTGVTVTYDGETKLPVSAGKYKVVAMLEHGNYEAEPVEDILVIGKATAKLNLSGLTHTYDGTGKVAAVTTDPAGLTGATVTYNGETTLPVSAGRYEVAAMLEHDNYEAEPVKDILVINKAKAQLSLSGLTHTYDGTGKVATVTTDPAGLTGATVTYNGETTLPVSAGRYEVAAMLEHDNYEAEPVKDILVIGRATSVITWNTPTAITHGTALSDVQLSAISANDIAGDFVYEPGIGEVLDIGDHWLKVRFTPTDIANYLTAEKTVVLTVTDKLVPVVTWNTPDAITYGTALSEVQLNATADVEGSFTYSPAAGAMLPAGTHTLKVTFVPTDANYAIVNREVTLTVGKAEATITSETKQTRVYDGLTGSVQATLNHDETILKYSPQQGYVNAGSYVVTVTAEETANYKAAEKEVTLEITKAMAKLTLSNLVHTYDGNAKAATVAINPAGLTGIVVTYNEKTALPVSAGSYNVMATLDNANYAAEAVNGTLVIGRATPVIITGDTPDEITYGTALDESHLDVAADIDGTFTYVPEIGTVLPAGKNTIQVTFTPKDDLNYITTTVTVELTVNRAEGVLQGEATQLFMYDGKPKELAVRLNHAESELVYLPQRFYTDAGTYTVTVSAPQTQNHKAVNNVFTLRIEPSWRSLDFPELTEKVYGDADFDPGAVSSSGESVRYTSDDPSVAEVVNGQIRIKGVGTALISATVPENTNYENRPEASQVLTVRKAAQVITLEVPLEIRRDAGTVPLTVRSSSGLPVSLSVDDGQVATLEEGPVLRIHRLGTVHITATQMGDVNHEAAEPVTVALRVVDNSLNLPVRVHPVVSPNGDGINEFLMIEGIRDYPENKVKLFNRNGTIIYEAKGYDNDQVAFRGIGSRQLKLPAGTYFYILEVRVDGRTEYEKGYFILGY